MRCFVFWTAIAGPQYSNHPDEDAGWNQVEHLVFKAGHSQAYLYIPEDKEWTHYTKGVRGRLNMCEIPADEVPKVYRLLLTLEG